MMDYAGPLYTGLIQNKEIITKITTQNKFPEEQEFIRRIEKEADEKLGFYDVHELARILKINPPKIETILEKTNGVRTHFSPTGIKTKKSIEEIKKIMLSLK